MVAQATMTRLLFGVTESGWHTVSRLHGGSWSSTRDATDRSVTSSTDAQAHDADDVALASVDSAPPIVDTAGDLPREGSYDREMSVDPRAAAGFAGVADVYARGRPGYPAEAIDWIVAELELNDESSVLDLAAGTAQVSRLIRNRVRRVIAVEPVQPMRARIADDFPDVTVLDGTAEAIPLTDRAVDAVVVGEAFHWFATVPATAEIARVLRPNGGVALLWNTPSWTAETTHWLEDFRQVVRSHKQAAGDYPAGNGRWRDEFARTQLFTELEHVEFDHTQTLTPPDFLALVASWSWIANLDAGERQTTLDAVAELIEGIGQIEIPYRSDLYLARPRA